MSDSPPETTSTTDFSLYKTDPEAHQIWTWRRSLKIGKTKDSGDLQKCYEAMPKGMYTRNRSMKENFHELVTGPRPHFLNPYELESIFVPKHKTKKEARGSNPVRRRRLVWGRYKHSRGFSRTEYTKESECSRTRGNELEAKRYTATTNAEAKDRSYLHGTAVIIGSTQPQQSLGEDSDWEDVPFESDIWDLGNNIGAADNEDFMLI